MIQHQTTLSEDQYSLLGIEKEYQKYLIVTDSNESLIQIHYRDTISNSDNSHNSDLISKIGCYRGWVLDTKNKQVVCRSFEYTPEKIMSLSDFTLHSSNNPSYYPAIEGTIIRVFTHDNQLYCSTHRKLDCKKSRWGSSKTFYQMLQEACIHTNFDINTLKHPSNCYVLLLVHPDNQIVNQSPIPSPYILHLDSWTRTSTSNSTDFTDSTPISHMIPVEVDIGIPKPSTVSTEQALSLFADGKALISSHRSNKSKYLPTTLAENLAIRGNNPNIKNRWYELRSSYQEDKLKSVLPPHQKSQVDNFSADMWTQIDSLIQNFLLPQYLSQLQGNSIKFSHSHQYVINRVRHEYTLSKNLFFSNPSNSNRKFYWGRSKLDTNHRIASTLFNILSTIDGKTLYKCISDYNKYLKRQQYLSSLNSSTSLPSLPSDSSDSCTVDPVDPSDPSTSSTHVIQFSTIDNSIPITDSVM